MLDPLVILAGLAAASAGGMRLSMPLLLLILLSKSTGVCSDSLVLEWLCQPVALILLIGWFLIEVVATKTALGQRVVQGVQFIFAPVVGALLAAAIIPESGWQETCLVITGGAVAATLQLVQTGYLFRTGRLPLTMTLGQDFLAMTLVLLAVGAPLWGGLLAVLLVLLALHQTYDWQQQFGLR